MSSIIIFVNPQAAFSFCPMIGIGIPGKQTPLILNFPPFKCISYHHEGCLVPRWGSLDRMGLPDSVLFPLITQLFEPITVPSIPISDLIFLSSLDILL